MTPFVEESIIDFSSAFGGGLMNAILEKKGFICDMDGVIYHGSRILDGVKDFVN